MHDRMRQIEFVIVTRVVYIEEETQIMARNELANRLSQIAFSARTWCVKKASVSGGEAAIFSSLG